ncbi:MAG: hypothetical protein GC200_11840 [Tepidisphaera sp.]|nr:hypothetical protein [Tepidisphaera sp.]
MARGALISRFVAASVMGVMVLGGTAFAQPAGEAPSKQPEGAQPRRPRAQFGEGREGRGPSVEGAMKAMGRSLKALKGQIADANKKEENLSLVAAMEMACVNAKGGKPGGPAMKAAKTDAEKQELTAKFRAHLIHLGHALLDLESQVMEGKTDEAKASIEKIEKIRDEGHHLMGLDKEDEKGEKGGKGEKNEKGG